jgi:hypothetical protein
MICGGETSTSSIESCSSPANDLQLSQTTALGLPTSSEDHRYFNHFRNHAVQDLASTLDADIWRCYILKIGLAKPAVKHAILAVSAQHELFLKTGFTNASQNVVIKDPVGAYSWKHYVMAVQQLRLSIRHATSDRPAMEETIVTCLLLTFIEVLYGNYPNALMHLEGGLQIFSSHYPSGGGPKAPKPQHDDPMKSLARIFKRLDIQASSYLGDRSVTTFSVPCSEIRSNPPVLPFLSQTDLEFITKENVRDALDERVAHIYKFLRSTAQSLQGDPLFETRRVFELRYDLNMHARGAQGPGIANVMRERQQYLTALGAWACAFEVFLERSSGSAFQCQGKSKPGLRSEEVQQCAVLWLSYLVTLITLSTCFESDETSYDEYLPQFQKIVYHSRSILHTEVVKTKTLADKRLSLEMSVIHPLFITAFKCRDPTVRRDAISLLHISGQEGVWNGKMLAKIVEHVVKHEESQSYVNVIREQSPGTELAPGTPERGWEALKVSEKEELDMISIPEFARVHGVHPDLSDPGHGTLWFEYSTREFIIPEGVHGGDSDDQWETYKWVYHKAFIEL